MFTKGPYYHEGPDMFGDYNILHPADSLAIGAVVSNLRPPEEVKANADLLASATDLLEALEAICSDLNDGDFVSAVQIARNAGRAAISKARGS